MADGIVKPSIAGPSLQVGIFAGISGLFAGSILGIIRSRTPAAFATAAGIQWFTIGTTYWATKKTLILPREYRGFAMENLPYASALAGGAGGAVSALLFRSKSSVIPVAIVFSGFGYIGQRLFMALDERHTESLSHTHVKSDNILTRIAKSRWSPVEVLTDEQYRKILQEKLLRVDAEIALIDDRIEEARQALKSSAEDKTSGGS